MTKKNRPRAKFAVGASLKQTALDILAEARRALEEPSKTNAARIHDFRKAMKRFRALLRLVPTPLDEMARHLRTQGRDLARELGGSRDSQSALDAIRDLVKAKSPAALSERSIKSITNRLAALKKSAERTHLTADSKLRLIAWIESTNATIQAWPLEGVTFPAIADGLLASYRRARREWPDKWSVATSEEIHDFRQRVIVHRYQLDLLEPLRPRLVRKWTGAAQGLRGRLGRYQDLTLLLRMSAPGHPLAPWRVRLEKLIKQRQSDHLDVAARSAARVFAASPKAFRKRIETLASEAGVPN